MQTANISQVQTTILIKLKAKMHYIQERRLNDDHPIDMISSIIHLNSILCVFKTTLIYWKTYSKNCWKPGAFCWT